MFCSVSLFSTLSFAQTANTLPTNGKVGIGTTTPNTKLEVVGSTKLRGKVVIDSTVIVKDSVTINKRLTIKQDIKVVGKSVFVGDVKAKADLRVLGVARMKDRLVVDSVARMKNKLVVDGLTRLNGDAKVFGDFKLPNLSTVTNPLLFLTVNQNGKVSSFDKGGLTNFIYQPQVNCLSDVNGNLLPVWKQNPNPNYGILYTGTDCPARVGIGTDNPIANLDVRGNSYTSGFMGIGDVPNSAYPLSIKNNIKTAGIYLLNTMPANFPNTTPRYGIKNVVNSDDLIAYSVTKNSNNQDVFVVKGDGSVGIGVTNPVNKLEVCGTIRSTEWIVETGWCDYKFEPYYKKMTWQEKQDYIVKYKHLPEIDSEKNIEINGLQVGKTMKGFIWNIEDNTIDIISLYKENSTQKEQIDVLVEENDLLKTKYELLEKRLLEIETIIK